MSHTINKLRHLSDDQLIKEHDEKAKNTVVGTKYYMEELDRRSRERNEKAMHELAVKSQKLATRTYWQSWISVAASVLALIISAIALSKY